MAERLWDAQARGLANWLRELASIPASGEGWGERLLAQLGSLYLLLEGHRRLDILPEPLRADIRSRIGWSWQEADLPVDAWFCAIAGCWSVSAATRKNRCGCGAVGCGAGIMIDWRWCWTSPIRTSPCRPWPRQEAGWRRNSVFSPVNIRNGRYCVMPSPSKIRKCPLDWPMARRCWTAMLRRWPGNLGWRCCRRPWPSPLPVRRESDTWFLRDAAAKLLPCHPGFIETWRLLACSGGSPLTVFGEWNGQQFWPLVSWRDGQLTAFDGGTTMAWRELVTCALLGTERQARPLPATKTRWGRYLAGWMRTTAKGALLRAAGVVALWRRAGRRLADDPQSPPPPCEPDAAPGCGRLARQHLALLLQGHDSELLPEWLEALGATGRRVPEEWLPALLDAGAKQTALRPALLPVLGQRGRWLARHNSDWSYAVGTIDETIWQTGRFEERLALLRQLRAFQPERGRENCWPRPGARSWSATDANSSRRWPPG